VGAVTKFQVDRRKKQKKIVISFLLKKSWWGSDRRKRKKRRSGGRSVHCELHWILHNVVALNKRKGKGGSKEEAGGIKGKNRSKHDSPLEKKWNELPNTVKEKNEIDDGTFWQGQE